MTVCNWPLGDGFKSLPYRYLGPGNQLSTGAGNVFGSQTLFKNLQYSTIQSYRMSDAFGRNEGQKTLVHHAVHIAAKSGLARLKIIFGPAVTNLQAAPSNG